jgi:hypothetical protein
MGKMTIQFDIQEKNITVDQAKSELTTEEDLLESAVLAAKLLISLTELLSNSKDKVIHNKLAVLKDNLLFVLNTIIEERDM